MVTRGVALGVALGLGLGAGAQTAHEKSHSVTVSPGGLSLAAAVEQARASGGAVREIVLADGDYFLDRTVALDARDSGLVVRAAHDGRAVLWGGTVVTGWRREGDRLWAADVPTVRAGSWDFRALFVDGRLAERAVYPSRTNFLEHAGAWQGKVRAAIEGYWSEKPKPEEMTSVPYRKGDLPPGFDPLNADVRLYHMWNESYLHVVSNDAAAGVLHFDRQMTYPAGAFGKRKYQVLGIREGLTEPGEWYLDRRAGKVVYWPRSGEDMRRLRVVAPRLKTLVSIRGSGKARAKGIRIEGLVLTATEAPCMNASFGGSATPAAIEVSRADDCAFERLTVRHVGASGLLVGEARRFRLTDSTVSDCGSTALCVYADASEIASNRFLRVGLVYPSACAVTFGGAGSRLADNEIADSPYSGVILRGVDNVIEGNHVSRVMQTLHDGAAVYGNMARTTIRRNVVRDVVERGKGFGASAFYCDETSEDNVIEENVTVGVPDPVHLHIVRGVVVRNNTFVTDGDLRLSLGRSVGCTVTGNTFVAGGCLRLDGCETSVTNWGGNAAWSVAKPGAPVARDCALKTPRTEKPRTPIVAVRNRGGRADGALGDGEYGERRRMDRDSRGVCLGAAPSFVQVGYDDEALQVGVQTLDFRWKRPSTSETDGDAVTVTVAGHAFTAYFSGAVYEIGGDGVRTKVADACVKEGPGGMCRSKIVELRLPFAKLGVQPKPGVRLPFNASRYASAYRETRWYAAPGEPTAEIELGPQLGK